jgi:hypothetical protein
MIFCRLINPDGELVAPHVSVERANDGKFVADTAGTWGDKAVRLPMVAHLDEPGVWKLDIDISKPGAYIAYYYASPDATGPINQASCPIGRDAAPGKGGNKSVTAMTTG